MKVVFPRSGSLVLLKQDLETLREFYNTNLLTSQFANMYNNSTTMIQIKNLNYIPKSDYLVLDDAHVLTIDEMREILGISNKQESPLMKPSSKNEETAEKADYISDNDILSNPFFTTLTPIN